MALDKLGIYNDALLLIGSRRLDAIDEDRTPRHYLDSSYDFGAVEYCLELVKPVFSRKTAVLNSPVVSVEHDLDNVFNLPDDFICLVGVYSDPKLDQEITRYINENKTIACEYDTIYVRYVSNDNIDQFDQWTPSFFKVVSSYLATEICQRVDPDELESTKTTHAERVEIALSIEDKKEPKERSKATTRTLTQAWLNIYNDALLILGKTKIVDVNDDSHRRSVLDTAVNSEIVEFILEDIGWHWATTNQKILRNPSVEPDWGYENAFDKPADMHRFDGIFSDEFEREPIKNYYDDQNYFFASHNEVYIKYISKDYINNPELWKPSFKKLVAAKIALESCPTLAEDKLAHCMETYKERNSNARSIDVMQSPPRVISEGSWNRARTRANVRRDRP